MGTLQKLLNLGLLGIGSDDSRFSKMEDAGTDLVELLKNEPPLIIPAALIAIDSEADENDPFFALVEKQVIEHWKTMRNTHVNRPRELLRSIIIHTLSLFADGNAEIAAVIWQTVVSPMNFGQSKLGKESEIVIKLVKDLGTKAEDAAIDRAGLISPAKVKSVDSATEIAIKPYKKVTDAELVTDVARAAGPQYPQGTGLSEPNPHWPNAGPPWSNEFTPRMTAVLAKGINLGMGRVSEQVIKNSEHLKGFEQSIKKILNTIQANMVKAQRATQIKVDVMWWSKAMYSPTLMRSYREMSKATAAVAMASDLCRIVSAMSPASVTYVLGEAIAALCSPEANLPKKPIKTLIAELRTDGSELQHIVSKNASNKMRCPLFNVVAETIHGEQVTPQELHNRTGIDSKMELTIPEFAMWTFRDMQVQRLLKEIK